MTSKGLDSMPKDRNFCKRLKELREKAGFTQAQVEDRSGLPATIVCQYEIGSRLPGLQSIKALCKGLGCTASDLIGI